MLELAAAPGGVEQRLLGIVGRAFTRAQDGEVTLEEINPWFFRAPLAPVLAARMTGRKVRIDDVVKHLKWCARRAEVLLVEGAGGLLSPLGEGFDSRDLIHRLSARVIVVAPNRLGAVNQVRLVLAATLGASYGIYGPPFENCVGTPVRPGSEEYLDSEKYQLRHWDWESYNPLRELIARINQIRRRNPALQSDHRLRFYHTDNDRLLFYGKTTPDLSNVVLVAVNLDPHHTQSGWVRLPLEDVGLRPHSSYEVEDLLTGVFYLWHGETNFVSLHPGEQIHAVKAVSFNEQFFQGHFPGRPIMPGVLQIEALAQAAGVLAHADH